MFNVLWEFTKRDFEFEADEAIISEKGDLNASAILNKPIIKLIDEIRRPDFKTLNDDNQVLLIELLINRANKNNNKEMPILYGLISDFIESLKYEKRHNKRYGTTMQYYLNDIIYNLIKNGNADLAEECGKLLVKKVTSIPNIRDNNPDFYATCVHAYATAIEQTGKLKRGKEAFDIYRSRIMPLVDKITDKDLVEDISVGFLKTAIDRLVNEEKIPESDQRILEKFIKDYVKNFKGNIPRINYNLVCFYYHSGNHERVIKIAKHYLENLDVNEPKITIKNIYGLLSSSLMIMGKYEEAIMYARQAMQKGAFSKYMYLAYFNSGKMLKDEEIFKKLEETFHTLDPEQHPYYYVNSIARIRQEWRDQINEPVPKSSLSLKVEPIIAVVPDSKSKKDDESQSSSSAKDKASSSKTDSSICKNDKKTSDNIIKYSRRIFRNQIIPQPSDVQNKVHHTGGSNTLFSNKSKTASYFIDEDAKQIKDLDSELFKQFQDQIDRRTRGKGQGIVYLTKPIILNNVKYRWELKVLGKSGDDRLLGHKIKREDGSTAIIFDLYANHARIHNLYKMPKTPA